MAILTIYPSEFEFTKSAVGKWHSLTMHVSLLLPTAAHGEFFTGAQAAENHASKKTKTTQFMVMTRNALCRRWF